MKAVILAAGEGKRLRSHFNRPKPLVSLLGVPLIERNILTLKECNIKDFTIITGCYEREIKEYLGNGEKLGVNITYLHNRDWQLGNGVSAYTYHKNYRQNEKFILLMADHLFQEEVIKNFLKQAPKINQNEIFLAADKDLDKVYDVEECTKIKAEGNLARELGKDLQVFNAVDCGLFLGTKALLNALSQAISQNQYTLTAAVNLMAKQGKVKLHFIKGHWIDVDDPESYKQAEKILLQALVPPKDGFISRTINRKFSLKITKKLAKTKVTPNQITLLSFFTAVASSLFFAGLHPFWGGLLAQITSILDGVDGEIARLKFLKSKYGGLFDSILDRYGDFIIVIGMGYAWYFTAESLLALLICAAALSGIPMSMLFKEKFHTIAQTTYLPEKHDGLFRYLPANRDGRLFIIMLGGILNWIPATLIILAIVTHLQTLFRLFNVRKFL